MERRKKVKRASNTIANHKKVGILFDDSIIQSHLIQKEERYNQKIQLYLMEGINISMSGILESKL